MERSTLHTTSYRWFPWGHLSFLFCLLYMAATLIGQEKQTKVDAPSSFQTHPPMRPLPTATRRPLSEGPSLFVDTKNGDDVNSGSETAPWKTLAHSLRQLWPGDTLYLRGGVYYEKSYFSRSGTEESPITIRAYPGEMVIVDGGQPEFFESPQTSWEPNSDGAEGEYVSTRTYYDADDRQVPHQFLPAAWEPMWGIEEERPIALGNFADSMVPLHSYRTVTDLRAANERWIGNKNEMRETGIYCGPGLWFNRETGHVHIRLAHHRLEGLGERAYCGETDPRKLPLVVAVGGGDDVLRANGVKHVRVQDLVFRGATGSPMIHVYGSHHIEFDHLTIYGGFPALKINASQDIRVVHSAFRGLAAPWSSRAHMKYCGTASYQIVFQNNQPANENIELAWCEFTDDHDFAFLRHVRNLQFHHNFVDNFNDDGLECGPKLRDHTLFIYQNRIGRCLIPITQHEIEKDESPIGHDPASGVFLFRNIFDMRGGTYKAPPAEPDPSGDFLQLEGHLAGDHGGPIWPVMHIYHNTFLRESPVFRDYYLFGLGTQGLRNSERDVFNNIFVQLDRVPGVNFDGMKEATNIREGGNLMWGVAQGPHFRGEFFAKFRASPLFELSRQRYEHGWTTDDLLADPKFVSLASDSTKANLQLHAVSPAVNAGVPVSADWPDPIRDSDLNSPDIGALHLDASPWKIGIEGRMSLFGD